MSKVLRTLLGLYHVYFISYATIWDVQHPNYTSYAGRWKTLTFLTCMVNCWYFIAVFLHDILLSNLFSKGVNSAVKSCLDKVFGSVVCPAALLVVVAFWGLYYYNRAFIWPARMDEVIPATYAHMMHSVLGVVVLLELVVFDHKYPYFVEGACYSLTYAAGYVGWMYWLREFAAIWPYPLFYKLSEEQRVKFIGVVVGMMVVLYALQFALHSSLHPGKASVPAPRATPRAKKVRKVQ